MYYELTSERKNIYSPAEGYYEGTSAVTAEVRLSRE